MASAHRRCRPARRRARSPRSTRRTYPDELDQISGSIGGPIVKDKTFFFDIADYTMQDRTTFLSTTLPAFVLPADGSLTYVGHYRQGLVNGRLDHKLTPTSDPDGARFNVDHFYDTNPNDAVVGTSAPTVARRYTRKSWTTQVNHTSVLSSNLLNEARVAYLHGDPVTLWEAQDLSTTYTRGGSVPFTIGESRSSDLYGHQFQIADTLSWNRGAHNVRFGGSVIHHTSGRIRQRAGHGGPGHVHVPEHDDGALRSADAGRRAAVLGAGQLRHHELQAEAVDVGGVRAGQHPRERSVHGRRRPSLRPPDVDRCDEGLRAASRIRLASRRAIGAW